ncbi:MAG: glycosyl transferase, family 2 [Magnetococcales bacterium]|nr:glycosyl transferase, family 2 [Magnetococcales bacterium]HIJ84718.1 glycosyltransferase [Magnetococcales bacterium]
MTGLRLSIIIPVLNDAVVLSRLVEQLGRQTFSDLEILVADGGSLDDSVAVAQKASLRVVVSPPGRGRQMNAAAREAYGQQLLFLHADSSFSHDSFLEEACRFMTQQLAFQPRTAGHFPLCFVDVPPGNRWPWRFWEEKSRLNRPECIHGDQGLWISRPFFAEIGGFDTTYPFLEERRVAHEITRLGQWVILPGRLGTSARRFCSEGLARRAILNALIMVCHAVNHHDFLKQAPALYRQQKVSGVLPMRAFFRLLEELDESTPPGLRRQRWYAIGRVLRQSVWQIFLFFDVLKGEKRQPIRFSFLAFYHRRLEPWLPRLLPDPLAGGCARLLFRGLRAWFQWRERCP